MRSYFIFKILPAALIIACGLVSFQQSIDQQNITANIIIHDNCCIPATCSAMFLSAKADVQGKPFLYIAAGFGD